MGLVDEAIGMWERYRAGVIAELENIPEEHWDHAPADGARTLRELALHIAESGVGFSTELTKADPNLARLFDRDSQVALMAPYPAAMGRAEVIDLLRTTGADDAKRLRVVGEGLAARTMEFMGEPVSVLTALTFASAHEMYHRGQLAIYARVAGQVPVLTTELHAMLQHARK